MDITLNKYMHCTFLSGDMVFSAPEKDAWAHVYFGKLDDGLLQSKIFEEVGIKTDKSDIDPNTLGKLYFTKSASVPRYKVREVKDKYNLSVIRDSRKADTIVISKNEVKDNIQHSWGAYMYPRNAVKEVLEKLYNEMFLLTPTRSNLLAKTLGRYASYHIELLKNSELVKDAIDKVNNLPESIDYISFSYGCRDRFDRIANGLNCTIEHKSNVKIIEPAAYEGMMSYKGKNVITDSALQSILGSSGMEHENYVFIDQLLDSNDPGNIELGLTLMANSNFEESQHYLLILLGDHYNKHRYVKYCHSVAFKSLMDFMDFNRYSSVTLDSILEKADSVGKLNDDILNLVRDRATEEIQRSIRNYRWIKVTGIKIEKPQNDTN
jgi:hypothetical protein